MSDLFFTFDVEVYAPLRHDRVFLRAQGEVWQSVLEHLQRAAVRTTFFVTGEFVETYPVLFDEMVQSGHEIASHTMTHRPYFSIGDKEFENEIARSKNFLEDVSQTSVSGFRAPLGQIPSHLAALLKKHGYHYDSSVAATHIPGHFQALGAPQRIYHASLEEVRREDENSNFWEIPIAVTPKIPLPYGGFFLSFIAPVAWRFPQTQKQSHVMFSHPHDFIDMRKQAGCYAWDRFKITRNNWRMLAHFCRQRQGSDARLCQLPKGESCF